MFRADRQREAKGGGLVLYVKDHLDASLSPMPRANKFKESIWCNITLDSRKLLVGLVYRSPSSDTVKDERGSGQSFHDFSTTVDAYR